MATTSRSKKKPPARPRSVKTPTGAKKRTETTVTQRTSRPRKATAAAADGARESARDITPAGATAASGGPRRAIFIDVENTSSETELIRVLDELAIDRVAVATEVSAVGNWRVIGQQLGRMLASRGAHLVHSAPATRVRDWSDLWIAVSAGMWLGRASSGDSIDIISDDRAFDAVGDAAARLGVAYRRISCRGHHAVAEVPAAPERRPHAGSGGRRRRRRRGAEHAPATHPAALPQAVSPGRGGEEEPHAASQAQLRAVIARLTAADPERGVSLDALTVALKAEGFQRPPGSPRLITRLRRLKDVEVTPNGRVRLVDAAAEIATAAIDAGDEAVLAAFDDEGAASDAATAENPEPPSSRRRSRRRGGRRRSARRNGAAPASAS